MKFFLQASVYLFWKDCERPWAKVLNIKKKLRKSLAFVEWKFWIGFQGCLCLGVTISKNPQGYSFESHSTVSAEGCNEISNNGESEEFQIGSSL